MKVLLAAFVLAYFTVQIAPAQTFPAVLFQAEFGGSDLDSPLAIVKAKEGGYLLGGFSESPVSGNKTASNLNNSDYWVVKIGADGNKLWDRTYGGYGQDRLSSIVPTADSGYLLGGQSYSATNSNKTAPPHGDADVWVVKIDADGNRQWDQSYGGSSYDQLSKIQPAGDGGFLLVGGSYSPPGPNKTAVAYGGSDVWVVKIDASGNQLWDKSYGGTNSEFDPMCVAPTSDGGFVIGCSSYSNNNGGTRTAPSYGDVDFWIVRIDSNGNQLWDRSYGGDSADQIRQIIPTTDGGFLLAGWSTSGASGNKSSVRHSQSGSDAWIVKVDALGNKQWDASYGGTDGNFASDVAQTEDGGFLLFASSSSPPSGTKTAPLRGPSNQTTLSFDLWIIKTDPFGHQQWDQTYGGSSVEYSSALLQGADGNYLLLGYSGSDADGNKTVPSFGGGDYWLVKIASTNPPAVTSQPQGGLITQGENITLSVGALSFFQPAYQWRFNGQPVSNETNATLVLSSVQATNAGSYTCFLSNRFGFVESAAAVVTYSDAANLALSINPVLTIYGTTGRTHRIEATLTPSDPTSWLTITNLTLSTSPQLWIDPRPNTQTNRFYRAVLLPP